MTKQETMTASVSFKADQQLVVMGLLTMAVCVLSSGSANALAFTATGISTVLCNAAMLVVLDMGRGLASLALIAIGISAMLGKATWAQALSLGVGIGVVFGALNMATMLTTGISSLAGISIPALPCL